MESLRDPLSRSHNLQGVRHPILWASSNLGVRHSENTGEGARTYSRCHYLRCQTPTYLGLTQGVTQGVRHQK